MQEMAFKVCLRDEVDFESVEGGHCFRLSSPGDSRAGVEDVESIL